tara:strand:- start:95 stop:589 length:495 start_codon:yes stop_codon:yes gene_type:complete
MTTSSFWTNVLEPDENLLWSGRPQPKLNWRNWRFFGPAPMAATGLLAAAWFVIYTTGSMGDMWLLVLPALLVLIPLRTTQKQLRTYAATRYALTDKRVLFFKIEGSETRVAAHPRSAMIPPVVQNTLPPSVSFLRHSPKKIDVLGFDFIQGAEDLLPHLKQAAT